MKRILSAFLHILLVCGFAAAPAIFASVPAFAQQSERRIVVSEDADYFGGDYDILKDVTLDACQAACLGEDRCKAFTYNVSAGWCFKKETIGELRSVAGAVSGQVVTATAADPDMQGERRAELAFLPKSYMDQADQMAEEIERRQTRGLNAAAVISAGHQALNAKDPRRAADLFRDALALDPTGFDTWGGLMSAVFAIQTDQWRERQELQRMRVAVAANLYLAARSEADRALALHWLGRTLGDAQSWKPAIRAYRASLRLVDNPRVRTAYDLAVSQHGFRLLEHRVDSDAAAPQICLVFSDELPATGLDASDYVRVEGGQNLAIEASAREICIDGVKHGERYAINVRAGLPAADGETIENSIPLDIYVRDRQPSVRFPGTAYVLPGNDDATIPVVTVNTPTVNAKLYRVGDRALVQTLGDGQFLSQLNSYQGDRLASETGQFVWEGTVEVEERLNGEVVSAIPVSAITAKIEPGAYVLIASAPSDVREWEPRATQWFIVTDLGLSAVSGTDGFHAMVRSLTSAAPVAGVNVRLIAKNNQVLATGVSDATGSAVFDAGLARGEGGLAPAMLVAETDADGGDYSFLDLTRSQIDLTDRGVEGREPPGPLDVYLTVDRGIYRPGETVHASALVRDATADAVDGLPLTLIVHRPDGKEAERRLVGEQSAGGSVSDIDIAGNAMRGSWRVGVYSDPDGAALAEASYLVEDFLPERLDFTIGVNDNTVAADEPLPLNIDARYLYGAPAGGLDVSGRISLTPVRTLDAFSGYMFGLADEEDQPVSDAFESTQTDENGHVYLEAPLPVAASATRPLTATVYAQVADTSGRPVERSLTLPVMGEGLRIGLRPLFDGAAGENSSSDLYLNQGEAAWPPGTTIILSDDKNTEISRFIVPQTAGDTIGAPTATP